MGGKKRKGGGVALRAVLLAALVAACASTARLYEGEPLPRDEVAVVTGMSSIHPTNPGITARVESVDGREIPGGATRVELLPGQHEFVVQCSTSGKSGLVTTTAELVAGGSYVIAIGLGPDGELDALVFER